MHTLLQRLSLIVVCVALLNVCGCSGSPEPAPEPSGEASTPSDLPPGKEGVLKEEGP